MQTLVIDTNGIVKKLEQRGFPRTQAEGITEALKELDVSSLVTKADLELALPTQTTTIITWMFGALLAQGALVVAPHPIFEIPAAWRQKERDEDQCNPQLRSAGLH
jgi:hypothetical protein